MVGFRIETFTADVKSQVIFLPYENISLLPFSKISMLLQNEIINKCLPQYFLIPRHDTLILKLWVHASKYKRSLSFELSYHQFNIAIFYLESCYLSEKIVISRLVNAVVFIFFSFSYSHKLFFANMAIVRRRTNQPDNL